MRLGAKSSDSTAHDVVIAGKLYFFLEIEVEQGKILLCIDWWEGFGFVWQDWTLNWTPDGGCSRWKPLGSHLGDYARKTRVFPEILTHVPGKGHPPKQPPLLTRSMFTDT